MIPIFEQSSGRGIGHGLESFLQRFDEICAEHTAEGRARAFAFIFYDFTNEPIRSILRDQGVFAQLDRLSGRDLSLFYLHAGTRRAVAKFNHHFLSALGVREEAVLPCVVFFRVSNGQIADVEVIQLENADLIHGFGELYEVVESYIARRPLEDPKSSRASLKWLKSGGAFVALESFRAMLRKGLEFIFLE